MAKDMTKLRARSDDELGKDLEELREAIWKLRLQVSIGQLQDPQKVRLARRDLARVMTVKRERELVQRNAK